MKIFYDKHLKNMETEGRKKGRKPKAELSNGKREVMMTTISELYLMAYGFRMISNKIKEQLGIEVSHTMVKNYVGKLRDEWKKDRINNVNEQKSLELQKIDRLENTYWLAWERSIENIKKTKNKQRAKPVINDGGASEMAVESADKEVINEERLGDPRYLEGVRWCIAKRCEILGLDAPISANINHSGSVVNRTVFKTKTRKPQI